MKKVILFYILICLSLGLYAQPTNFDFVESDITAIFLGQAEINNIPSEEGDWIAAFDSQGNCVGANAIVQSAGIGYIVLTIYGDDPETELDEGMDEGELFTIQLWDASISHYVSYPLNIDPDPFTGWTNNNGAPMSDYDDPAVVYNFTSLFNLPCTLLNTPINGAENVPTSKLIKWFSLTEAEGYKISLGDQSGIYNYLDQYDVGTSTNIFVDTLECATTYFVKIIPYNDMGDQINCDEESFSTIFNTADAGEDVSMCNGNTIQLNGAGGLTYSWTPSEGLTDTFIADPLANPSSTTTYFLTAFHSNGCVDTDSITVTVYPEVYANITGTNETSQNANNGSASANPTHGTAPYFYNWNTGAASQSIINLTPGIYTVTVIDDFGCIDIDSVEVLGYNCFEFNVFVSIIPVSCNNDCDGYIAVQNVTNGTEPFTYLWNNGSTTETISDLCSGLYSLTITDSLNCTAKRTFIVNNPDPLNANVSSISESDYDANNGLALSTPLGGTAPFSFVWSNDSTEQVIENLEPGNYTVTVTDAKACATSETMTIDQFGCESLLILSTNFGISCYQGCNGSITIDTVIGATPPYTYEWDTGAITNELTDLCPGTYMVTVTDADSCRTFAFYSFDDPDSLNINLFFSNETADNANNGSATVTPVGGIPPYFFMWSNGSTAEGISGLYPDDYTVTVVDANNCSIIDSFTVEEYICPIISNQKTFQDVTCYNACDGIITHDLSGGTVPYQFVWSNGASTSSVENLCPGDYMVTIIDAGNCMLIDTTSISQEDSLILEISIKHEFGNNTEDGSITTTVVGGATPYQFLWNTGETTSLIDSLAPGIYSLTLTDANDCQIIVDDIEIDEFDCLSITINHFIEDIPCYGMCTGSISITNISEGTFPFTYEWSNGELGNSIIDKCAGIYTLTLTDANDCVLIQEWEITEPPEYNLDIDFRHEVGQNQNNGFIHSDVAGGTPPTQYLWSNGATTPNLDNITAGVYTLSVTDLNGCILIDSAELLTVDCDRLDVVAVEQSNTCFDTDDAFIDLSISNAWEPISIIWSNGSDKAYLDHLVAGDYTVTVVDDYGCTKTVTYVITTPDELIITLDELQHINDTTAYGSVSTTISGGTLPYEILWTGSDGFQSTNDDIDSLTVDCFHLDVVDNHGCHTQLDLCIADLTTGTGVSNDQWLDARVALFPNPNRGIFKVSIDLDKVDLVLGSIMDMNGKWIASFDEKQKEFDLDLSTFQSGVYILQLKIDEKTIYKKIYIQK